MGSGCNFCDEFKAWWKSPFQADMSAARWFMFIVLISILFGFWHMIFRHIRGVV